MVDLLSIHVFYLLDTFKKKWSECFWLDFVVEYSWFSNSVAGGLGSLRYSMFLELMVVLCWFWVIFEIFLFCIPFFFYFVCLFDRFVIFVSLVLLVRYFFFYLITQFLFWMDGFSPFIIYVILATKKSSNKYFDLDDNMQSISFWYLHINV